MRLVLCVAEWVIGTMSARIGHCVFGLDTPSHLESETTNMFDVRDVHTRDVHPRACMRVYVNSSLALM